VCRITSGSAFVPDGALRAERRRDILPQPGAAPSLPLCRCATAALRLVCRIMSRGQQPESLFESIVRRRCASAGRGRRGIEGLCAPGERATEGHDVASEDTFLTPGMQRWLIGMRLRNVRTPGEGGAGGGQNSVAESLLRGQSAAGPNARGARCPSAADQSSVFNRHIALVDWAVGRNLRRSY